LSHPCWSPDGTWIAWLGSIAITDPSGGSVFVLRADGTDPARNLTVGFDGTARWLGVLPGSDRLAFLADEHQATVIHSIDPASGQIDSLNDSGIFVDRPSFDRTGKSFAAAIETPEHPSEVYLGSPADSRLERLADSNPALRGLTLGAQEVTRWTSTDGLAIEGVLIKPVGYQPGRRYPVVVHVHGGSEGVESNGWFGSHVSWGQLLAARGYAVIYPNYRGSTGRGTEFVRANRRDLMGKEWDDIETALDHVIELGIGDPDRAGIYGFSWGGYAAGWGATWASHRFKAAVGGAGIYNWTSEAGMIDSRTHEQLVHWDLPLYGHGSYYLERSPITHVRKAETPMLLMVGELDPSAPLGQSIEMHTALKWKGVPVELVVYPREGHGIRERPHQIDFLNRGLAWFDRYLRPGN
jgi:dipeptidyl aminopeptidase/acylaminoacyl peptidase